jgi:hypothetical protein
MNTSIPRNPEGHRILDAYIIFTEYNVQYKHQHSIYHSCKGSHIGRYFLNHLKIRVFCVKI